MAASRSHHAHEGAMPYYPQQQPGLGSYPDGPPFPTQTQFPMPPQRREWQQEGEYSQYGNYVPQQAERERVNAIEGGYKDLHMQPASSYPPMSAARAYVDPYATPPPASSPQVLQNQQLHNDRLLLSDMGSQPYTASPYHSSHSHVPFLPPSPTLSDGIHPDRPLQWDRLTAEQRIIAESFPKDLDEEGKTMRDSVTEMLKDWRSWIKWNYWYYYVTLILLISLVVVFIILHNKIVTWLTPISAKVNSISWGWVIPVAILFVISFPPLFGHEVIGILCGVVYPFWEAFGIVALGTLLGEWGNFWAFGACLKGVAARYERKSLNYACMAHIVREGGFFVILVARLSAIPGHFTTAVFSTVGMSFWMFTLAAILSMPKQLAVVYVGYAIATSGNGEESTSAKIIKWFILVISGLITVAAAWYLYRKMEIARPEVQKKMRLNRFTLLSSAKHVNGPGSLVKRGDDGDGFSLERRTVTEQDLTQERGRGTQPRGEAVEGDVGIVVDPYSNYDEAEDQMNGGVKAGQLRRPQGFDEDVRPVSLRNVGNGFRPQGGFQRAEDDIQMRQMSPAHTVRNLDSAPVSSVRGVTLGIGIASMPDAEASTERLLSRRQNEQVNSASNNSSPRMQFQIHQGDFIPHEPRGLQPATVRQSSSSRVEPLDVNVLLAATSRSTPPRPAPGTEARSSPPRYETLDWSNQDGGPHRVVPSYR